MAFQAIYPAKRTADKGSHNSRCRRKSTSRARRRCRRRNRSRNQSN